MKKINYCVDCKKKLNNFYAKRCKSCANKSRKGKFKHNNKEKIGEKNPMWKGDNVGRQSLHRWVERRKPKLKFCEKCKERKPYDLANISGGYKRDINDFRWLCRKCHMIEDKRLENLHQNNIKWRKKWGNLTNKKQNTK